MEQRLNRLPSSPRSHFPPETWRMLPLRPDERRARDAEAVRERHQLKLKPVPAVRPMLAEQAGPLLELVLPVQAERLQAAELELLAEPPAERPVPASW